MAVLNFRHPHAAIYSTSLVLFALIVAFPLLSLQRNTLWEQHDDKTSCPQATAVTTVVVGAGVIGLCTAYQLAKTINERPVERKHRVIVIENASEVFPATSSTNTGILSYTGFIEGLRGLGQYSYEQWEALGRGDPQFNRECGYKEGANIALQPGSGEGFDLIPDWIRTKPGASRWDATPDPEHGKMAIINPVALGIWLYKQCLLYGVEFRMNSRVVSANLSHTDDLLSLNVLGDNEKFAALSCDKLVLAAGPWTPTVFRTLFPQSSVNLEPVISAGEWIVFENPNTTNNRSVSAVYLDKIVGQKLEFAGRNDHTIWATGEKNTTGEVPDVGDIPRPNLESLEKLKVYATHFLKRSRVDTEDMERLRVLNQGRSYRPATRTGLPLIGGVPASKLATQQCHNCSTRVYINSGHGSYGITLGMGSGKLMTQMVLSKRTDLDISMLGPS